MPSTFAVTAASDKVVLTPVMPQGAPPEPPPAPVSFDGQASFTVSNTSAAPVTGVISVLAQAPAVDSWFTVPTYSVPLAAGGSGQVAVNISCPAGTPAGTYTFTLYVKNEGNPDEDSTGQAMTFELPKSEAPKKKFPWWILIIVAIVLIGGGIAAALIASKDKPAAAVKPSASPSVVVTPTGVSTTKCNFKLSKLCALVEKDKITAFDSHSFLSSAKIVKLLNYTVHIGINEAVDIDSASGADLQYAESDSGLMLFPNTTTTMATVSTESGCTVSTSLFASPIPSSSLGAGTILCVHTNGGSLSTAKVTAVDANGITFSVHVVG